MYDMTRVPDGFDRICMFENIKFLHTLEEKEDLTFLFHHKPEMNDDLFLSKATQVEGHEKKTESHKNFYSQISQLLHEVILYEVIL